MAKLLLLDGHSLAYRAYFALPTEMATSDGEPTNATFGFTQMLLDVLDREQPTHAAIAFDVGRTWRHESYADYKGTRAKSPPELKPQIERIKTLSALFGLPLYSAPGWEADDVLGTLAHQADKQGVSVLIVTGDTDAHQLVTERVHVQTSGRFFRDTKVYDLQAIRERYGLEPSQLVDYKALVGDKSDNIPGVDGIGPKGATTLLQSYGTLDGIYEHLDEVRGATQKKLAEGREAAFISQKLGRIDLEVPGVTLDLAACERRPIERAPLFDLFRTLQFTSLVERLPAEGEAPTPDAPAEEAPPRLERHYTLVDSEEALERLVAELATSKAMAFDVETDGQKPVSAALVGISLSVAPGTGYYLPIAHRAALPNEQLALGAELPPEPPNLPLDRVREALNPLLCDPARALYAHNARFDVEVLRQHGFTVPSVAHDTKIAAWLLNPGSRATTLKGLALSELGEPMTEITELIGTGRKQIQMSQVPLDQVLPYAAADADMTFRLVAGQEAVLKTRALDRLFHEIEMPLVDVLVEMERYGVLLDVEALDEVRTQIQGDLARLEEAIFAHAGTTFNIGSPQQLSEVLFEQLALPKNRTTKTRTGAYSTASNVLESLADEHEIAGLVLEHRSLQKLLSTYVEQLPAMVNPETGRIHTEFSQTSAETGRLSSSNPNLQNIPVRTDTGRKIRAAFIAPPGEVLLSVDYSQVELRVLAHLSGDAAMVSAFDLGEDIHAATAQRLFHLDSTGEVTKDQRRIAKVINYGLLFGMGAFRLAREAGLPYAEADEALHTYFRSFPSIAAYLDGIVSQVMETGYAETIMGRRRYFPALRETPSSNQARAEIRAAKNHPIQGSAAEIIKIAMIRIHEELSKRQFATRMVLQVHDELLFEVPEEELAEVAPLLLDWMRKAMTLTVPLEVEAKVGRNWDEMLPLAEFYD